MKASVISLAIALTSALVAAIPEAKRVPFGENSQISRRQATGDDCNSQCSWYCGGIDNVANAQCNKDGSADCKCQTAISQPSETINSRRQAAGDDCRSECRFVCGSTDNIVASRCNDDGSAVCVCKNPVTKRLESVLSQRQAAGDDCKTQCGGPCGGVDKVTNSRCNGDGSAICACQPSVTKPSLSGGNSRRQAAGDNCRSQCNSSCGAENVISSSCQADGTPLCACRTTGSKASQVSNSRRQAGQPPFGNNSPEAICKRKCITTCGGSILKVDKAVCDASGNPTCTCESA
ncbi:hypothetical protein LX36DRAFT_232705 [Colletotrichum falcatum]|nr:hypothetical protein LX36DRAFT_232705 [Colletotrichum falcatum]